VFYFEPETEVAESALDDEDYEHVDVAECERSDVPQDWPSSRPSSPSLLRIDGLGRRRGSGASAHRPGSTAPVHSSPLAGLAARLSSKGRERSRSRGADDWDTETLKDSPVSLGLCSLYHNQHSHRLPPSPNLRINHV
jgi:hypothetical protein